MPYHGRSAMLPVDYKVMPLRFVPNCTSNRVFQFLIRCPRPQNTPEVGRIVLPQTHIERPGAGQPLRLQLSQKLCVIGVMKPSFWPVSRTVT